MRTAKNLTIEQIKRLSQLCIVNFKEKPTVDNIALLNFTGRFLSEKKQAERIELIKILSIESPIKSIALQQELRVLRESLGKLENGYSPSNLSKHNNELKRFLTTLENVAISINCNAINYSRKTDSIELAVLASRVYEYTAICGGLTLFYKNKPGITDTIKPFLVTTLIDAAQDVSDALQKLLMALQNIPKSKIVSLSESHEISSVRQEAIELLQQHKESIKDEGIRKLIAEQLTSNESARRSIMDAETPEALVGAMSKHATSLRRRKAAKPSKLISSTPSTSSSAQYTIFSRPTRRASSPSLAGTLIQARPVDAYDLSESEIKTITEKSLNVVSNSGFNYKLHHPNANHANDAPSAFVSEEEAAKRLDGETDGQLQQRQMLLGIEMAINVMTNATEFSVTIDPKSPHIAYAAIAFIMKAKSASPGKITIDEGGLAQPLIDKVKKSTTEYIDSYYNSHTKNDAYKRFRTIMRQHSDKAASASPSKKPG